MIACKHQATTGAGAMLSYATVHAMAVACAWQPV